MEYNKLIAEMSLSDEVEGFYVLKAAYARNFKVPPNDQPISQGL